MSEYTPRADEVRDSYVTTQQTLDGIKVLAGKDHPIRSADSLHAEFDRWLDQVRAEVWHDGWNAGVVDEACDCTDYLNREPNPYRSA